MLRTALITGFLTLLLAPASDAEWFDSVFHAYEAPVVPPIQTADSPRLSKLIRAGNIYLSLADCDRPRAGE